MESRHAKTPKDQRIRAATIVNDDNCRSEEIDLKPHQRTRKLIRFRDEMAYALVLSLAIIVYMLLKL
jgi:hypothetical protein